MWQPSVIFNSISLKYLFQVYSQTENIYTYIYIYTGWVKKNRDYQCFGQNFQNFFLSLKSEQTNILKMLSKKSINPFFTHPVWIQGYSQRMRLQRRLYGICTVCFIIFMISCNRKLDYFFAKHKTQLNLCISTEWHREIKMYCQWAFTFEPILTCEETVRVIFKWPYGTSWWPPTVPAGDPTVPVGKLWLT